MSDTAPTASAGFPPANPDGTPALIGPDEYTKKTRIDRINQNNTTVLSGNYADLQRAGADAAVDGKAGTSTDAYAAPPGIDPKDEKVVTPAQHEAAKGEWTRETERTGLLTEPEVAPPADNDSPDSIDPTSVSPTVADGTSTTGGTQSPTPATSTSTTSTTATKK